MQQYAAQAGIWQSRRFIKLLSKKYTIIDVGGGGAKRTQTDV